MDLRKYQALQTRVEELQREASKAEGVLEQLKRDLEKEFDCKTIKQAKRLLTQLEQEEQTAEIEFQQALEAFETEHGELLR